ncbi:MAG: response regulator transcription factor, partial [Solirubrobacteraceae bacterium]
TLTASAVRLLAAGAVESVAGDAAVALSHLTQATGLLESAGDAVLLAYSPAELVAVVAAQSGETALADATLGHAVAAKLGGGLAQPRHLLLHGWNAMTRGALQTAQGVLDRLGATPLEPGDELFAAALATGLARRSGDSAALGAAFARGRTALIRHPVDLYLLRQLGELAVAAALLDERETIAPHLDQAWTLLAKLGEPPLWTVPLHWSELHADLAAGDLEAAQRRAKVLSVMPPRYAKSFAVAAAGWLRVARGDVDPDDVRAAAVGLHHAGLTADGAQLAASASVRTTDRKDAAALMAFARNLSDSTSQERPPATEPAPTGTEPADVEPTAEVAATPLLSERELEVGRLILAGLTHKQIGARLFISAKTVEHHVARMRNRLGADGRNELFGMLRNLIGDTAQPVDTASR